MQYVGIKNCSCKSKIVSDTRIGHIIEVLLPCLSAPDCERHFEILKLFDKGITNITQMKHTLYYKFNVSNGKKSNDIRKKIKKFYRMYRNIQKKGYDYSLGYIVVSKDGARLDGSHRASIVEHLKYDRLKVRMIKWNQCCSKTEIKWIKSQLAEQRKLYNMK